MNIIKGLDFFYLNLNDFMFYYNYIIFIFYQVQLRVCMRSHIMPAWRQHYAPVELYVVKVSQLCHVWQFKKTRIVSQTQYQTHSVKTPVQYAYFDFRCIILN